MSLKSTENCVIDDSESALCDLKNVIEGGSSLHLNENYIDVNVISYD